MDDSPWDHRGLSAEEMEELLELEWRCYPPGEEFSEEFIRLLLNAAYPDGRPAAHLGRRRLAGRLVGFQIGNLRTGELITLDVHPDYRRRGVGSSLLTETLNRIWQAGRPLARCTIATDNQPSLKLHEAFGFNIRGTLPRYYSSGRDAYLLVLPRPDSL
jgi:ribosomal-protein-alanine N-acetyltransferase